jgi:sortase A
MAGVASERLERPRGAVARRVARATGLVLIVAGVLGLAWAATVWFWQDPFTSIYTRIQQHHLASRYEHQLTRLAPPPPARPAVTVAEEELRVAAAARRYRAATGEGDPIGRIRVPALGLNMILVDGTDHDSLTKGPGRDLRTYMPGQHQLVYIAGHRTTYLAPFSHIDRLKRGDRVTLELPYATFVYRVTGHVIVPSTDLSRLRSHGREVVALQACHPRFFATQRYIVYAAPVRVEPRYGKPYVPA